MKWLIWREYRLNRLILIAGAVLMLLPYAFALVAFLWPWDPPPRQPYGVEIFAGAAVYSLVLAQIIAALLGGNAMAGERSDRSAEFMAYLPSSRARRLGSKLCLAFLITAFVWIAHSSVFLILYNLAPEFQKLHATPEDITAAWNFVSFTAITGLVFFGVSWLISSFQSSPTFAVGGALVTPMLVLMGLLSLAWLNDAPSSERYLELDRFVGYGYAIICSALAVVCFSIGTWYYLRRIEP